jgi:hypothetical protein
VTAPKDPAARAIACLRAIQDTVEFAARSPGERVEFTRQETDQILDDLGIVARAIREREERSS